MRHDDLPSVMFSPDLDAKEFTFHNVTVTILADTAKEAYARLCQVLGRTDIEYQTSTVSGPGLADNTSTQEVWPPIV